MFERNKILKKICYPHILIVISFTTISILGLIYSFTFTNPLPLLQYVSYIISAYTLTIISFRLPNIIKKIKHFTKNNKIIIKYNTDIKFKNKISLYINTSTNILFMLFYLIMGFINHSLWFYSLTVYYFLLSIMRFFLLKDIHKDYESNIIKQWYRYRFCGIVLVIINIALAVITFLVIHYDKGFIYHYIETIAIALFTFISTTSAIINSIKYRKYHNPIISATKFVSLTSCLVSMNSLEIAMLTVFDKSNNFIYRNIMIKLSSFIFCLIILSIGIIMIIKSSRKIKNNIQNKIS